MRNSRLDVNLGIIVANPPSGQLKKENISLSPYIAIKIHEARRELGRDGKILRGHRQDGNLALCGIGTGNLAR